jgi:hypothetical protein
MSEFQKLTQGRLNSEATGVAGFIGLLNGSSLSMDIWARMPIEKVFVINSL